MTPARLLTAGLAAAGLLSLVSLVVLLAFTPPFECGPDYESPATPAHAGGVALGSLVFAAIGFFVGLGLLLGLPRESADRRWAGRSLALSLVVVALAGGGVFADAARWTCWP